MKNKLMEIDKLLARIRVSGDDVYLLAQARNALGEVFRNIKEEPGKEKTNDSNRK